MRQLAWLVMVSSALLAARAQAAVDTLKQPVVGVSVSSAVAVSTFAYTNVSGAFTLSDQSEVVVANPSTNNATMHGFIESCTGVPAESTSTVKGPLELAKGGGPVTVEVGENLCLWLVSRHTATENAMVQVYRRRRQ